MDTGLPTVVWCLCLGLGLSVTPPLLAAVFGCVLRYGIRFCPTIPGWGFRCVRLGWCFGLRPAISVSGFEVCVFVCALLPYFATPGWVVRRGCLCLGSGLGCARPLLAGVMGCVCVCVRAPLYPATPGWSVWCWCVWLGTGFACAPPLMAGVLGCVCGCVRAPLVHRHFWLGCAVWVCVVGLGFGLRPATAGWGVGVCVCLCARSACTPPLLAGGCGVRVCGWARV